MIGNRDFSSSHVREKVLFLMWYLLSWVLCARLECKIAPAFTAYKHIAREKGSWPGPTVSSVNVFSTTEHRMLEIISAPTTEYLKEGETLNWNCLMRHQQDQLSQAEAHWYKNVQKQNETGFEKEMESLHLSQNSDPEAKVTFSLLLKIQKVNQTVATINAGPK